jgi:hypothetical protein
MPIENKAMDMRVREPARKAAIVSPRVFPRVQSRHCSLNQPPRSFRGETDFRMPDNLQGLVAAAHLNRIRFSLL